MCTHVSRCRGGMAVGSRWRSSWIVSSTSCLVRMPLRRYVKATMKDQRACTGSGDGVLVLTLHTEVCLEDG